MVATAVITPTSLVSSTFTVSHLSSEDLTWRYNFMIVLHLDGEPLVSLSRLDLQIQVDCHLILTGISQILHDGVLDPVVNLLHDEVDGFLVDEDASAKRSWHLVPPLECFAFWLLQR